MFYALLTKLVTVHVGQDGLDIGLVFKWDKKGGTMNHQDPSCLPVYIVAACGSDQPYFNDKMTCWVSSFSLFFSCGSAQKSTPSDVIHIVVVNGPFVQNGQVV